MRENNFFTGKTYKGTIEITNKLYEIIRACISNDLYQACFSAAYINNKHELCATNGKIAFFISIDFDVQEGYYVAVKFRKQYFLISYSIDAKFPSTNKVIPNYSKFPDLIENAQFLKDNQEKNSQFIYRLFAVIKSTVNIEYLKPLRYMEKFNVKHEEGRAILFYNDMVKYVVMPMLKKDSL